VEEATHEWSSTLLSAITRRIPQKTIKIKPNCPWIAPELQTLIKNKDRAYKKWKRTNNLAAHGKYLKLKKRCKKEIPKAKEQNIKNSFSKVRNEAEFWKTVKYLRGSAREPLPSFCREDGTFAVSDREKAEELAKSFHSFWNRRDVAPIDIPQEPLAGEFLCDENDIFSELSNLRPNSSPGPDGLHPRILKEIALYISSSLTKLINRSLTESVFPEIWKQTNVTPVPKKTGDISTKDFRPISLTSFLQQPCCNHW
jgi:hypothetical protein